MNTTTWSLTEDSRALLRNGTPAFMLADTLWAAFTRPSIDEWSAHLQRRRRQGFNAINISILPIAHDQSASDQDLAPFDLDDAGQWDLGRLSEPYFARAATMAEMAVRAGITPVLVVLWCNYVPETWGSRLTPQLVMNDEQTCRYTDLVAGTFGHLNPVFAISGDERFDSSVASRRYETVLRQLRTSLPSCLMTMHTTPDALLPPSIADSADLSFYTYQSGHDVAWSERSWQLAQLNNAHPVTRPVIDLEPCYEGHGYGSGEGRHSAADVRLASWSAVLSGAAAGLGYGAHGVWSWHREGDPFNGEHFSGTPFAAEVAADFRGAWDVGLLRRIVESEGLYRLRPAQELVSGARTGVRVGQSDDRRLLAVYVPSPFAVRLIGRPLPDSVSCWDLEHARLVDVDLVADGQDLILEQPAFLGDALFILHS